MAPYMTPYFSPYMAPYMVPYIAPCMVSYMAPYMAPYMTPHGIQVGRGREVWGVSKSMGSLRGGAPHKLAGGGGSGGRAAALPPQEDPTIVDIHPYIQISICPYQYQFISIQSKIHNPEINDLLVKKRSTSLFGIFWSSDWYHIEIFRTHFSIRIYLA